MTTDKQRQQKSKKYYTPPKLVQYGTVRDLTQSGPSGVPEAMSSSKNKKG